MRKFNYSVSTSTIWTSFDSGQVEADNIEEAKEQAIEKLKYDFEKANNALAFSDNTLGFTINFDESQVTVTEEK